MRYQPACLVFFHMCEMSAWKHCCCHHHIQKLHLWLSVTKPPAHTASFNPHNTAAAGEATWPCFTDDGSRWKGRPPLQNAMPLTPPRDLCLSAPILSFHAFMSLLSLDKHFWEKAPGTGQDLSQI